MAKIGAPGMIFILFVVCAFVGGWVWAIVDAGQNSMVTHETFYNEAVSYMESGDYVGAVQILGRIGGWKDSDRLYDECLEKLETIQWDYYALINNEGNGA